MPIELLAHGGAVVDGRISRSAASAIVPIIGEYDPRQMLSNSAIKVPRDVTKVYLTVSLLWGAQYPATASLQVYVNGVEASVFAAPRVDGSPEKDSVSCVLRVSPGDKITMCASATPAAGNNYASAATVAVRDIQLEVLA